METGQIPLLNDVFVSVPDPRSGRQARHSLSELLTVAVCAVLCGADDFVDIAPWGRAKLDWLRGFLRLEADIPSHDTFGRVFGLLDAQAFEAAFLRWVGAVVPALAPGSVVAIDGKTSRRSTGKDAPGPLHLVSAFAAGMGLVLGQRAPAEKSNEITGIPELLATLALKGTIVTIDAMGTQTDIARTIRKREADYVLAVRDNHPKLVDSILLALAGVAGPVAPNSQFEEHDKPGRHGRAIGPSLHNSEQFGAEVIIRASQQALGLDTGPARGVQAQEVHHDMAHHGEVVGGVAAAHARLI